MMTRHYSVVTKFICIILTVALVSSFAVIGADADGAPLNSPRVVVSLGDSYSAGEGIQPFYGQDKSLGDRVNDLDWIAHRSKGSWPGQLKLKNVNGTLSDYFDRTSSACKWYFQAVSGAETKHLKQEPQIRKVNKIGALLSNGKKDQPMPLQLDVFDEIKRAGYSVDYVTMSIGGNDVDFTGVVIDCIWGCSYIDPDWVPWSLKKKLDDLDNNLDYYIGNVRRAYEDTLTAAGPDATLIVAGYPQLFENNGKGLFVYKPEAQMINTKITKFNERLEETVKELRKDGKQIEFVDIESEFNMDGGHLAYSKDPWIEKVSFLAGIQDIDDLAIANGKSMHPNQTGALHYANCVNKTLTELENRGNLAGKVCKASDRSTPITNAQITVYKENESERYTKITVDESGNYSRKLPTGNYRVEVNAEGYIPFTAYATVTENEITYMETFLMVEGEEGTYGVASGTVKNALTGGGIADVNLTVRSGWSNDANGEIIATATTSANGTYSFDLPLGNYTVCAEKDGYISTFFNIVVQTTSTGNQNGTMTPIVSGDNFRVVLTWGQNPSDLDSHVVGTLNNGDSFHVYYGHKSQFDGSTEVCNLDVDDTTSYGPETITLNVTSSQPYYYYIYKYAGTGTVAASGAQIKVYQGENLVATYNVPTDQGGNNYWNVFAIVDGTLVTRNTITSSAELNYASTSRSPFAALALDDEHTIEDDRFPAKEEPATEESEESDEENVIEQTEAIEETTGPIEIPTLPEEQDFIPDEPEETEEGIGPFSENDEKSETEGENDSSREGSE